ncbi:MAG: ketoacyl-ACP synthase III [Nitrospinae bacterium]|nr:ketoacyl-ACP synthase III [Nitrospinota bacterium]
MIRSKIVGTGSFLPEKILTNFDLEKMVETTHQWIVERSGIIERRIAEPGTAASDLAAPAALKAVEAAGMRPEDVELIIVGTSTPDMLFPSTACFVQSKIGAKKAAAFDLLAACSSFVFGLSTADALISSGRYKNALVIGAEVYSSIVNWADRTTCVLFGDGAGAVMLAAADGPRANRGIISTAMFSDGTHWSYLNAPGGGSANRFTPDLISEKKYALTMKGSHTFKVAVKAMAEAALAALEKGGVSAKDLKMVVPHQANLRIISAVAKQLGLDEKLFYVNLDKYGNTASASIPIALDEAVRNGTLAKGDLVLLVTFGGGYTWGSALIEL